MTSPTPDYRVVAGLRIPLPLVARIVPAMVAKYPEATAGLTDPDAAVRAALKAWVRETLADYESAKARAPLNMAVAQTVQSYEDTATAARAQALADAAQIVDDDAVA